jgi:hypothetical protein
MKEMTRMKTWTRWLMALAFVTGSVATAHAQAAAPKTAAGTVKSVSAESLVVASTEAGKEATWTFALDPTTRIARGGKDVAASDLKAGDSVQVLYTDAAGKSHAVAVTVRGGKPRNPCAAPR